LKTWVRIPTRPLIMRPSFEILKRNRHKFLLDFSNLTDKCIIFTKGYIDQSGYGRFQFCSDHKKYDSLAHRTSFMFYHNSPITSDQIIMHTCDTPACINPLHLKLGTHEDNVRDRVLKNRSAIKEKNGRYTHGKFVK
jgi:hypothetical protein